MRWLLLLRLCRLLIRLAAIDSEVVDDNAEVDGDDEDAVHAGQTLPEGLLVEAADRVLGLVGCFHFFNFFQPVRVAIVHFHVLIIMAMVLLSSVILFLHTAFI